MWNRGKCFIFTNKQADTVAVFPRWTFPFCFPNACQKRINAKPPCVCTAFQAPQINFPARLRVQSVKKRFTLILYRLLLAGKPFICWLTKSFRRLDFMPPGVVHHFEKRKCFTQTDPKQRVWRNRINVFGRKRCLPSKIVNECRETT